MHSHYSMKCAACMRNYCTWTGSVIVLPSWRHGDYRLGARFACLMKANAKKEKKNEGISSETFIFTVIIPYARKIVCSLCHFFFLFCLFRPITIRQYLFLWYTNYLKAFSKVFPSAFYG